MRSCVDSTSPSVPTPPEPSSRKALTVFSPAFLARLEEQDGVTTAGEAEYAGPWTTAPMPERPGEVAVVRAWERVEEEDVPRGVFRQEEVAKLFAVALPLVGREPLFHLGEEPGETGVPGYPVIAVEGEAGPQVCGWLTIYEPEVAAVAHVLQGLVRSPAALAVILETAGADALAQVDRLLGRQMGS